MEWVSGANVLPRYLYVMFRMLENWPSPFCEGGSLPSYPLYFLLVDNILVTSLLIALRTTYFLGESDTQPATWVEYIRSYQSSTKLIKWDGYHKRGLRFQATISDLSLGGDVPQKSSWMHVSFTREYYAITCCYSRCACQYNIQE